MEDKPTFDFDIKEIGTVNKLATFIPRENYSITLSSGITFKLIGSAFELPTEDISYTVLIKKTDGLEFKVSFTGISPHLRHHLLAHAVYELHDLVPMQCPNCKHNL